MTKTGSKDDRESAANTAPDDVATATGEGQAAGERALPRARPQKAREPLHALIVHFDARGSSTPSAEDQEA
jgi:hypothetical protein